VDGAFVPVVLTAEGDRWVLIGELHIHGIIDGEAVKSFKMSEGEMEVFKIWQVENMLCQ